jgi:hypothetical protein
VGNEDLDFTSSNIGYFSTTCLAQNGIHCSYGNYYRLMKTTDLGENWDELINDASSYPRLASFINDTIGYFLEYNNIRKTIDGANTFTDIPSNIGGIYYYPKYFKFLNEFEGYVVKDNNIYKTTSNGINWFTDYNSNENLNDAFFTANNYAYVIGENGNIIRNLITPVLVPDTITAIFVDTTSLYDFGIVTVGLNLTNNYHQFSIRNLGNTDLEISLSAPIAYAIKKEVDTVFVSNIDTFILNVGEIITINVTFSPQDNIIYNDTIFVYSNATNDSIVNAIVRGEGSNFLMGQLINDTTLCQDTVKIDGDVWVAENVTVTICPGTVIEFQNPYNLYVNGSLIAIGTENDSIIFTSKGVPNNWYGIYINNSYVFDTSIFEYCKIKNSLSSGIQLIKQGLIIKNSDIYNNSGAGIVASSSFMVSISNCNIYNNTNEGVSFGDNTVGFKSFEINNSKIYNNLGIGIYVNGSNVISKIYQNLIFNNSDNYNTYGIYCSSDSCYIINNIITNNSGGGIYFHYSDAIIKNTIIYGNDNSQIELNNSNPEISYCNIRGGYAGIGNIDEDPKFINPTSEIGIMDSISFNWAISPNSPCVDMGIIDTSTLNLPTEDIVGNSRIMNNRIDIGAYENQFVDYPQNTTVCNNDSVSFEVNTISQISYSYQWFKDGANLSGETNNYLTINPMSASDTGQYYCFVYSLTDTINTYSFELSIENLPIIISQSQNDTINLGDTITLFVQDNYASEYSWYKDDTIIINEINNILNIDSATLVNEGLYVCNLTNVCGTVQSDPIVVVISADNVDEITIDENILLYPNPTTGKINIDADNVIKVEVINLQGKQMYLFENKSGVNEIDLSNIEKGMYVIKITTNKGIGVKTVILE